MFFLFCSDKGLKNEIFRLAGKFYCAFEGGGVHKNLTHADRGEGGVHKNLTFAHRGGSKWPEKG